MDIALIADKNSYRRPVTYQIIEWKPVPTNTNGLIVGRVFASVELQSGEILYSSGTYLPVNVIITSNPQKILSYLFRFF